MWFTRILVNGCLDLRKARVAAAALGAADVEPVRRAAARAGGAADQRRGAADLGAARRRRSARPSTGCRTASARCSRSATSPSRRTAEVSRALGLSEATVRVHLFRAVRKLRALLRDDRGPRMTRHHLTDTELLALHFDRPAGRRRASSTSPRAPPARRAARAVARAARRASTRATAAKPTPLFAPSALARQQARIMGRVAQECRSARIISFPAAPQAAGASAPAAGTRWVAAAVAAGVILGIVGEHVHAADHAQRPTRRAAFAVAGRAGALSRCAASPCARSSVGSDDEFLRPGRARLRQRRRRRRCGRSTR